jgi:hypothetical protein
LINVIDLAVQWHHRTALVYGAFLALGTGLAYTCGLRPRIIANEAGLTVVNPLRSCTVPWTAITSVDVGEAVQVHCWLPDGTEKVIPSWGLSASSRGQLRADMRARRRAAQVARVTPWQTYLPAGDTTARAEVQLIAQQLAERAQRARAEGAAACQPTVVWSWASVAAIAAPAIALVTLLLT